MICAARNEAEGRSRSAAERVGRERSEDGAVHPATHKLGSLCLGRVRRPWHSLPRRSRFRRRCGTWVPL